MAACFVLLAVLVGPVRIRPDIGYGPIVKEIEDNKQILENIADHIGIPRELLNAIAAVESGFISSAHSEKGATGLIQVMPATALEIARDIGLEAYNLKNPVENSLIGALYLRSMIIKYNYNIYLALAAYNAGPANVDDWISHSRKGTTGASVLAGHGFRETRRHVAKVLGMTDSTAVRDLISSVMPDAEDKPDTNRYVKVVCQGDTLCRIASHSGVNLKQLLKLNLSRLKTDGDGALFSIGQILWIKPLVLSGAVVHLNENDELNAGDVMMVINQQKGFVELDVNGVLLKRFPIVLALGLAVVSTDCGNLMCDGFYHVVRKTVAGMHSLTLQLARVHADDACDALLDGRITWDEYDRRIEAFSLLGDPQSGACPQDGLLIGARGDFESGDSSSGVIMLEDDDMNELFGLTPEGVRVIVRGN